MEKNFKEWKGRGGMIRDGRGGNWDGDEWEIWTGVRDDEGMEVTERNEKGCKR